jgi:CO/xanthine dehydrogenase Mo-binding subunit
MWSVHQFAFSSAERSASEREQGVLIAAANEFGWGKSKPAANHGFRLSCGFEKGGYVVTCVEIRWNRRVAKKIQKEKRVRIVRVVEAFDCGAVVNPMQLKNQIAGSVVQAIGGALFESIEFTDGKILNPKFSSYRVPRFRDLPLIETVLAIAGTFRQRAPVKLPLWDWRHGRERNLQCDRRKAAAASARGARFGREGLTASSV